VIHDGNGKVLVRSDVADGPGAQQAAKESAQKALSVLNPGGQTHMVELQIASIGVSFTANQAAGGAGP
jgi:hypothetical protein